MADLSVRWGGWEILRNGAVPSNEGDGFEMGGLISLYGLCTDVFPNTAELLLLLYYTSVGTHNGNN